MVKTEKIVLKHSNQMKYETKVHAVIQAVHAVRLNGIKNNLIHFN